LKSGLIILFQRLKKRTYIYYFKFVTFYTFYVHSAMELKNYS